MKYKYNAVDYMAAIYIFLFIAAVIVTILYLVITKLGWVVSGSIFLFIMSWVWFGYRGAQRDKQKAKNTADFLDIVNGKGSIFKEKKP